MGATERAGLGSFTTAQQVAAMRLNQSSTRLEGMRGEGALEGMRSLRAQQVVDIVGVGGVFSGRWFLTRVTHRLGGDGYTTEFECER